MPLAFWLWLALFVAGGIAAIVLESWAMYAVCLAVAWLPNVASWVRRKRRKTTTGRVRRYGAAMLAARVRDGAPLIEVAWWRRMAGMSPFTTFFDVSYYLDGTGPNGARVISEVDDLPHVAAPSDAHEEVALLGRGLMGKQGRTHLYIAIFCSVMPLIALAQYSGRSSWIPIAMFLLAAPMTLLGAGAGDGWLRVATAAPGRVGTGGFDGSEEFTRDDSIVWISKFVGKGLYVSVMRRDGKHAGFACHDGRSDPALGALLGRWCYPAYLREKATRDRAQATEPAET